MCGGQGREGMVGGLAWVKGIKGGQGGGLDLGWKATGDMRAGGAWPGV